MNQRDFLSLLWPDSGWYVVAVPAGGGFRHFATQSLDNALSAVGTEVKAKRDVYFAMASFEERRVPSPSAKSGFGIRLQTNVKWVKSFWMDLDIAKPIPEGLEGDKLKAAKEARDKELADSFDSKLEAVGALKAFCVKVGLPKPMIVDSGGGIHAYWPLTEQVTFATWRPEAEKLKRVALACGLKIDAQCTGDAARVLRVPETFNFKQAVARPVTIVKPAGPFVLAEIVTALDSAVATLGITTASLYVPSPFDELGSNTSKTYDPIHFPTVVANCPQMYNVVRANLAGEEYGEPEWYAALSIARICHNPEKAIATVSTGHPKYTPEETAAKVARLERMSMGPSSCKKWQTIKPGLCDTCKWKDKVTSPRQVGKKVAEAPPPTIEVEDIETGVPTTVVLPNPPWPFKRDKNGGGVMYEVEVKEGEPPEHITILEFDMYPVRRIKNEDTQVEVVEWHANLPRDGWQKFTVDAASLADPTTCMKALSGYGVFVRPKYRPLFMEFMVAYVQALQKQSNSEKVLSRLGWREDDTKFVLPGKLYGPSGVEIANVNPDVHTGVRGLTQRGDYAKWQQAMHFYRDKKGAYEAHAFAFLTTFGAPLLKFTGLNGAIINLVGPSGASKSTVLLAANSVWGNPEELMLNGDKAGSTPMARIKKIALHNNLPICVDEITNLSPEDVGTLCYVISQGHGRDRLQQNGKLSNDLERWCTMMVCSANASIYSKLAGLKTNSSAEAARVFEMEVAARVGGKEAADIFINTLRENHGMAGEHYVEWLTANRDTVVQDVRNMIRRIDTRVVAEPMERYWTAAIAANVVGGLAAIQAGVLPWSPDDIRRIFDWACKHITVLRSQVSSGVVSPAAILAEFMNDNINNTLYINANPGSQFGSNIVTQFRGQKLLVRHELDVGKALIARSELKRYFTTRGTDYTMVKNALIRSRVLLDADKRATLGRGTNYGGGQTDCWWIDLTHPSMATVSTGEETNEPTGEHQI